MFRSDLLVYLIILGGAAFTFAAFWSVRDAIADEMFALAAEWLR